MPRKKKVTPDGFSPLFCIPNLVTSIVTPRKPWEINTTIEKPEKFKGGKDGFLKWTVRPETAGCHYSAFEGLNPHARVSKDNPPCKVWGLALDYDNNVSDEVFNSVKKRALVDHEPNFIHRSQSGNVRAVWLFETPVYCYSPEITKNFQTRIVKELQARRLFPGLDKCYTDPLHYYEIGDTSEEWTAIRPEPLSRTFLFYVLAEVSKKANWGLQPGSVKIPMAEVEAEAEKQYPGRWEAQYELGAQGVRFWDQTADNPRAAILRETGVQCFTGPKPFVTWREIFGRSFVQQFQSGTVGKIVSDCYFDGRNYWRKIGKDWRYYSRQDTQLWLAAQGLAVQKPDEEPLSECDNALLTIQTNKRVRAAVPLVHTPDGEHWIGQDRVLNTSTTKSCQPCPDEGVKWGQGFPFLSDYFDSLFKDDEQDTIFKAWLQRFYLGCFYQKPNAGQALLIGGPTGKGKTLLNTCVIGGLAGRHTDASSFLTGSNGKWGNSLLESAHWAIDDTTPNADESSYRKYSALLKKMTANREFLYDEKFIPTYMVPWMGRICITFNLDPESTRVIPDPEQSLLDKIILLKTDDEPFKFPTDAGEEVKKELPNFARWLLEWNPPPETKGESRYGVKCYHHAELIQAAKHSTRSAGFAEILEEFLQDWNEPVFEGTATRLLRHIMEDDSLKSLVSRMTADSVGRNLSKLASSDWGVRMENRRENQRGRVWTIQNPFFKKSGRTGGGGKIRTKSG